MIDSCWTRSQAFRVAVIIALFVGTAVPIFLLTVYVRIHLGISFSILVITARLVFGYVARKEGYVEEFKQLSPKQYYYTRRVESTVGSGFFSGFAVLIALRVLYGPLPYPQSFLLFLALVGVGAYVGDKVGRKLGWY